MADVMFKQGTQADLQKYTYDYSGNGAAEAIEGCFYLTNDTHRLYIGHNFGTLVAGNTKTGVRAIPVNQGMVKIVGTVGELSNIDTTTVSDGQFAYVSTGSILAIRSANQWIQLNAPKDYSLQSRTTTVTATAADNLATISDVIIQRGTSAQFESIYSIKGAAGLDVTVSGTTITLTPAPYELTTTVNGTGSASVATLSLSNGVGTASTAKFKITSGQNATTGVSKDANDNIVFSVKDTQLSSGSFAFGNGNGQLTVSIGDSSSHTMGGSVTPTVKYGEGYNTTALFDTADTNGNYQIMRLDVYTKSEVDALQKTFNAMVYRGTVASSSGLPGTGTAQIGDTYKATANFSIGTSSVKIGDLVIAQGTETDGVITSDLRWDVVPSGDESFSNTTYVVQPDGNGFKIVDNSAQQNSIGGFYVAGDTDYIEVSNSPSGVNNTVTVAHKIKGTNFGQTATTGSIDGVQVTTNKSNSNGSAATILVPVISYDDAGHITAIAEKRYTVNINSVRDVIFKVKHLILLLL